MRALAVVGAIAGLLVLLAVGLGAVVPPWSTSCVARDATGTLVVEGSPGDVAAAVDIALDDAPGGSLAAALATGPTLACRISPIPATDTAKEPPLGLTPNAQVLRAEVRERFGELPDGGFGPEKVLAGRSADGEHSQGRAIDLFFRPADDAQQAAAGWLLANWAVANAERLQIRTVIYRDHIWSARRSAQGWRDYRFGGPDPDNPVNRHLDHVHLDVA